MPYPRHMVEAMERKYGKKRGASVAIATMRAHPDRAKKALATARKRGHGGIVESLSRKKRRRSVR